MKSKKGAIFFIAALLAIGYALINGPNEKMSPLRSAIKSNDLKQVQKLLDEGHDPNEYFVVGTQDWHEDSRENVPVLLEAVGQGSVEIVKTLIEAGANEMSAVYVGPFPTYAYAIAVDNVDLTMIEYLWSLPSSDAYKKRTKEDLVKAAWNGVGDRSNAAYTCWPNEALYKQQNNQNKQASLSPENRKYNELFELLAGKYADESELAGLYKSIVTNPISMDYLLDRGIYPIDLDGLQAVASYMEATKQLLDSGFHIDTLVDGETILHAVASGRRCKRVFRYLVERGANLEVLDSEGWTAVRRFFDNTRPSDHCSEEYSHRRDMHHSRDERMYFYLLNKGVDVKKLMNVDEYFYKTLLQPYPGKATIPH